MASIKRPEQQNNEAKLFWHNVQRLRRECLNDQSRQPNRYGAAYKGTRKGLPSGANRLFSQPSERS